jgi:hypothetical protein
VRQTINASAVRHARNDGTTDLRPIVSQWEQCVALR